MGCNYYAVKKKPSIDEPIHIGKSSLGWKFLFHEVDNFDLKIRTFPQWKTWLEEHIGNDYVLLDEYDEEVELDYLFHIIEERQKENNKDDFVYPFKNIDGYRFTTGDFE